MALSPLHSWILLLLLTLMTVFKLGASLECVCTTEECGHMNRALCTAVNMCYVQTMVDTTDSMESYKVVRGCIDESMPLLCENRRPEGYKGAWPVLHCCQQDWCNNEILPTDPPWLLQHGNDEEDDLEVSLEYPETSDTDWSNWDKEYKQSGRLSSQHNTNKLEFNILYIAVPLAGACVMLAIVIFSLYLLKVKRQHVKNCSNKPQVVPSVYKQKVPLIMTADAKRTDVIYPQVTHNGALIYTATPSHDRSCESGTFGQPIKFMSQEHCESSAGSETRLLV